MSDSRYRRIIHAIKDFRVLSLPRIEKRIYDEESRARILQEYLMKINEIPFKEIQEYIIVAVDGGMATSNYENIHLAIATANTFSASFGKDEDIGEESEARILEIPPTEPNIVFSTYMKALEFQVAARALERIPVNLKALFLFDGAFTYPELDPSARTNNPVGKANSEYKKHANDYFELVTKRMRENSRVYSVAISKDALAGKYLKGLAKSVKQERLSGGQDSVQAIESLRDEEAFAERFYVNVSMSENFMVQTDFVMVSDQIRRGMIIPIVSLQKEGVFGGYVKPFKFTRPFYMEIPKWDMQSLKQICEVVCKLSMMSPRKGYPYPLVYADRLAKVKQELAADIFCVIEQETKYRLGKRASLVFDHKFRRKVNI